MSRGPDAKVVMIIDDDADVREALTDVLEDEGYRPIGARHCADALAQLRNGGPRPSVILLDLMMPVMDGFGFREAQRDDPALSSIPVVVLTAHGDAAETADRMDAAGSVSKPIELNVLLDTVATFCGPARP